MSVFTSYFKSRFSLKDLINLKKFKKSEASAHPDFFDLSGILLFCGSQGTGKTLSAVRYIKKVLEKFPKCILVTNTQIFGLPEKVQVLPYKGLESLTDINNDEFGVLYFIDEIHLEWNSLESKSVPIDVMVEISQQRKQRKHIVGTAQRFNRIAKPFREQVRWAVCCKNFFGCLQYNQLIDGDDIVEDPNGNFDLKFCESYFFTHNPEIYQSYDTFYKIKRYSGLWKEGQNK